MELKKKVELVIAVLISLPCWYWAGEFVNEPNSIQFLIGLCLVLIPSIYWVCQLWKGIVWMSEN